MNDNYRHLETNIFYVVENIMGPEEKNVEYGHLFNDYNSEIIEHCKCETLCKFPKCECLQKSYGDNYIFSKENKYKLNCNKESYPIFECNDRCSCSSSCVNRIVQNGPITNLQIKSNDKGVGVYTSSFIPQGTFVCEYAGELITKSQAARRHQNNTKQGKMNYIFCLKEHLSDRIVETIVDPSVFGNIGRYLNHSCEPNCCIVPVRTNCPIPKLAIFTSVDVTIHEELTFDYGSSTIDSKNETLTKCLCRSDKCIGYLPFHIS